MSPMAPVGLLRDARFRAHETTPNHPEHAGRLESIEGLLEGAGLVESCVPLAARACTAEEVLRVHDRSLWQRLEQADRAAQTERVFLDPDTVMTAGSLMAARLAAGGVIDATRALDRGELASALCLPRPPGHHATRTQAMGFCLINHVPMAVAALLDGGSRERVAIVDFDVHHGNGTQEIFYADPRVLYVSTHQFPHYPGTGRLEETGAGAGQGTTLNLPLPAGCGDAAYLACFDQLIVPALHRFRPQFLFVSAGFDAHWRDPLAGQQVSGPGYGAMAERLAGVAGELSIPTLYMLEGGYDLEAIAWAARHCLDVLLGNAAVADPLGPAAGGEPEIGALLAAARERHGL